MVITLRCEVVAKEEDLMGYQNIVFKNLDPAPFGHSYILCVIFPNWESRIPEIKERGYLTYDSVIGGKDEYYDRLKESFVKYNFTNLIFLKFVKEQDNLNKEIIL